MLDLSQKLDRLSEKPASDSLDHEIDNAEYRILRLAPRMARWVLQMPEGTILALRAAGHAAAADWLSTFPKQERPDEEPRLALVPALCVSVKDYEEPSWVVLAAGTEPLALINMQMTEGTFHPQSGNFFDRPAGASVLVRGAGTSDQAR